VGLKLKSSKYAVARQRTSHGVWLWMPL